jgi:hypothetical protein
MKQWRQKGEPVLRKQTVYCDGRRGAGGGGITTESIRVQVVTPALVHDLHGGSATRWRTKGSSNRLGRGVGLG